MLLPSAYPLFSQWLFAASILVPKAPIKSGLLAIYFRASKFDKAVGDEIVEPELELELELEEESVLPSAYPFWM